MAHSPLLFLPLVTHITPITHAHVIDCSLPEHDCANGTLTCLSSEPCFISCYAFECTDATIECPPSADCSIECYGENSCLNSHITGPAHQRGDLAVYCLGDRACLGSTIDGAHSTQLEINGCAEFESCLDISIYAPPQRNNSKHCVIHGNDNLGGTRIFAQNSWRDVDILYSGHFGEYDGKMFCGADLAASCEISSAWTCANSDDFCSIDENGQVRLPIAMDEFDDAEDSTTSTSTRWVSMDGDDDEDEEVIYAVDGRGGGGGDGGGFEDYLFVGAGVLALAVGWMICGGIRHVVKGHVVRQKSEKMGYGPYEPRASRSVATHTGVSVDSHGHVHRVNTEYVDPFDEEEYVR